MPSGLIALLDDVAGIAKLAAASIDDVGAAAGRASTKAAGVVIDDAAVTPRYVTGLSPSRELPIIGKIAAGSVRNKLLIILPVALLLSQFAPWLLTPILMVGGAYLCYEGLEKIVHKLSSDSDEQAEQAANKSEQDEDNLVNSAIRTDLILSTEIMVISLDEVKDQPVWMEAAVLIAVGIFLTVAVYDAVALLVKIDDIGRGMIERGNAPQLGRGLVKAMPHVLSAIGVIGTWLQTGLVMLLLLAGMNRTPDELYDAPANDFVMGFLGETTTLAGRTVRPRVEELSADDEADLARDPRGTVRCTSLRTSPTICAPLRDRSSSASCSVLPIMAEPVGTRSSVK